MTSARRSLIAIGITTTLVVGIGVVSYNNTHFTIEAATIADAQLAAAIKERDAAQLDLDKALANVNALGQEIDLNKANNNADGQSNNLNSAIANVATEIAQIRSRIETANNKITAATAAGAVTSPIQMAGQQAVAGVAAGDSGSGQSNPGNITPQQVTDFLTTIAQTGIQYVLVIAAIFIILAGYLYITSLGNQQKVTQAKQMLLFVAIGFLVVMGAYLAINTFVGILTGTK